MCEWPTCACSREAGGGADLCVNSIPGPWLRTPHQANQAFFHRGLSDLIGMDKTLDCLSAGHRMLLDTHSSCLHGTEVEQIHLAVGTPVQGRIEESRSKSRGKTKEEKVGAEG